MEKISSTRCRLKRNHAYFTQVQGQMGVTVNGSDVNGAILLSTHPKACMLKEFHLNPQFGVLSETNLPNIILNITLKLQQ